MCWKNQFDVIMSRILAWCSMDRLYGDWCFLVGHGPMVLGTTEPQQDDWGVQPFPVRQLVGEQIWWHGLAVYSWETQWNSSNWMGYFPWPCLITSGQSWGATICQGTSRHEQMFGVCCWSQVKSAFFATVLRSTMSLNGPRDESSGRLHKFMLPCVGSNL